jgi:hypothetical protein
MFLYAKMLEERRGVQQDLSEAVRPYRNDFQLTVDMCRPLDILDD